MTVEKGADELDTRPGYGCPLPRFLSSLYITKDVEGKRERERERERAVG